MIRSSRLCAVVFFLGLAATAPAGAADDDAPPPIRKFDVAMTETLGRAIYDQDQMAWKATDLLREQFTQAELTAANLRGWIVTTAPDRNVVRFIDIGASGPEALCDVAFTPDMASSCVTPKDRVLSASELAQYTAGRTAGTGIGQRCAERYNVVVLKDPEGDGWLVWTLAATETPGLIVYGGHIRFTMSSDGKTIERRDALSRSCITMPSSNGGPNKPVAVMFSQLVADIPVETTVWLSILHPVAFMIVTPDKKLWEVAGGHVKAIERP